MFPSHDAVRCDHFRFTPVLLAISMLALSGCGFDSSDEELEAVPLAQTVVTMTPEPIIQTVTPEPLPAETLTVTVTPEPLPAETVTVTAEPLPAETVTVTAEPKGSAFTAQPKSQSEEQQRPAQAAQMEQTQDVYFKNCTAARDAGAAPVHRGDPGYGKHLDRDGDGIGCE